MTDVTGFALLQWRKGDLSILDCPIWVTQCKRQMYGVSQAHPEFRGPGHSRSEVEVSLSVTSLLSINTPAELLLSCKL